MKPPLALRKASRQLSGPRQTHRSPLQQYCERPYRVQAVGKLQQVFKRISFVRFFELSDPSEAKKSRKIFACLQNFAEFSHSLGGQHTATSEFRALVQRTSEYDWRFRLSVRHI
jgi:hypothetical protein